MEINKKLRAALEKLRADSSKEMSNLIFVDNTVEHPAHALQEKLARFFRGSKWPHVQSHDFRVTFATRAYEKSKDIVAVSRFIGHKKVETTQKYIKTKASDITKAVAAAQIKD